MYACGYTHTYTQWLKCNGNLFKHYIIWLRETALIPGKRRRLRKQPWIKTLSRILHIFLWFLRTPGRENWKSDWFQKSWMHSIFIWDWEKCDLGASKQQLLWRWTKSKLRLGAQAVLRYTLFHVKLFTSTPKVYEVDKRLWIDRLVGCI